MIRDAYVSADGKYRYVLRRIWDEKGTMLNMIMLNPSTADGFKDDATTLRCVSLAKRFGHGGLMITNVYPYRTSSPALLRARGYPAGDEHSWWHWIYQGIQCDQVICGWGTHIHTKVANDAFIEMLKMRRCTQPQALRLTKDGVPCHPLYLPGTLVPFYL